MASAFVEGDRAAYALLVRLPCRDAINRVSTNEKYGLSSQEAWCFILICETLETLKYLRSLLESTLELTLELFQPTFLR